MRLAAVKTMNDESESIEPPSSTDAATDPRRPGGIRRWLKGLRNGRNGGSTLRETLEELIEQHEEREAPIDPRERQLIERILTVGAVTVGDAMVPRADIVAVECTTPLDEVVVLMAKETHSRLPVYRDSLDEVIGMVHIKDVLAASLENTGTKKMLPEIARPVLFVAPSMRVLDLLLQMRLARTHMALVVDEYGGVDGLITIEDAVEEIVGEIEDEHDETFRPTMEQHADGTIVADARLRAADRDAILFGRARNSGRRDPYVGAQHTLRAFRHLARRFLRHHRRRSDAQHRALHLGRVRPNGATERVRRAGHVHDASTDQPARQRLGHAQGAAPRP